MTAPIKFGEVLEALREGKCATRHEWVHGERIHIVQGRSPSFYMNDSYYVISHNDVLAEDWEILDEAYSWPTPAHAPRHLLSELNKAPATSAPYFDDDTDPDELGEDEDEESAVDDLEMALDLGELTTE